MRIVPKGLDDRIQFYEVHIEAWETNAEALGLSTEQMIELRSAIEDARAAREAAEAARQAAQTATQKFHQAVETLHSAPAMGAATISQIKARAEITGDDAVYTLAELPKPQSDSKQPAAKTPTRIRARVQQTGRIDLSWRCKVPSGTQGTVYQIARSLDDGTGFGPMTFVGIAGTRRFSDETLPAGLQAVEYSVTALRGTTASPPGTFTMRFGQRTQPLAFKKAG